MTTVCICSHIQYSSKWAPPTKTVKHCNDNIIGYNIKKYISHTGYFYFEYIFQITPGSFYLFYSATPFLVTEYYFTVWYWYFYISEGCKYLFCEVLTTDISCGLVLRILYSSQKVCRLLLLYTIAPFTDNKRVKVELRDQNADLKNWHLHRVGYAKDPGWLTRMSLSLFVDIKLHTKVL